MKEGTSAILLQSGLDEKMVGRFYGMLSLSAKCPRPSGWWKTPYERRFGQPFKEPIIPFGVMVEYQPISTRDSSRFHQFGKKILPGIFLGYELIAGESLERRYSNCGLGRFGNVGCVSIFSSKNQRERSIDNTERR